MATVLIDGKPTPYDSLGPRQQALVDNYVARLEQSDPTIDLDEVTFAFFSNYAKAEEFAIRVPGSTRAYTVVPRKIGLGTSMYGLRVDELTGKPDIERELATDAKFAKKISESIPSRRLPSKEEPNHFAPFLSPQSEFGVMLGKSWDGRTRNTNYGLFVQNRDEPTAQALLDVMDRTPNMTIQEFYENSLYDDLKNATKASRNVLAYNAALNSGFSKDQLKQNTTSTDMTFQCKAGYREYAKSMLLPTFENEHYTVRPDSSGNGKDGSFVITHGVTDMEKSKTAIIMHGPKYGVQVVTAPSGAKWEVGSSLKTFPTHTTITPMKVTEHAFNRETLAREDDVSREMLEKRYVLADTHMPFLPNVDWDYGAADLGYLQAFNVTHDWNNQHYGSLFNKVASPDVSYFTLKTMNDAARRNGLTKVSVPTKSNIALDIFRTLPEEVTICDAFADEFYPYEGDVRYVTIDVELLYNAYSALGYGL